MQSAKQSGKITPNALAALLLIQLVACHGLENDGDNLANSGANSLDELADNYSPSDSAADHDLPLVLIRQQSSSGSDRKPDFFLIWLLPYESMIPKPLMDMINQQVRPQTEQVSEQVLSQVPGGQEFWSQLSQLQSIINNAGGLQSVLGTMTGTSGGSSSSNNNGSSNGKGGPNGSSSGSNPLSSLLQGFGRRR